MIITLPTTDSDHDQTIKPGGNLVTMFAQNFPQESFQTVSDHCSADLFAYRKTNP
jgi:hypothetical protein